MTDADTAIENEPNLNSNAAPNDKPSAEKLFDAQKKLFLKILSVSGDVAAAATAAGHDDDVLFFAERQSSVAFYAEWDAAMDTAYLRLESALVAGALKAAVKPVAENDPPEDLRTVAMWHRLGLSLLAARRIMRKRTLGQPQNTAANTRSALLTRLNLMRERTEYRNSELKSTDMACNA